MLSSMLSFPTARSRSGLVLLVGSVLVALAACGGTTTTGADSAGDGGAGTTDGATSGVVSGGGVGAGGAADAPKDAVREANVAECPAAFTASPPGHCTIGVQCGYDEGNCVCAGYCGGAAPPPDTDFSHWRCTPKRTDGCPDTVPMAGSACATPGKTCQYDDCCAAMVTCTGGKWSDPQLSCPP
jgi:hypothetical protein